MMWLYIILGILSYIAIGQFVCGMLYSDTIGEIIALTIGWPIAVVIILFVIPFHKLRNLGRKFGEWIDDNIFVR